MKTKVMYQFIADDGTIFHKENDCLEYESLTNKFNEKYNIPNPPTECNTYIQFDAEILKSAKETLWEIIIDILPKRYPSEYPQWEKINPFEIHHQSQISRILYESNNAFISKMWRQWMVWDEETGRIYDQPYTLHTSQDAQLYKEK